MVYRAGRKTLAWFNTGVVVETKADESPVTVADREAEASIRHDLSRWFPGEGILGEEMGGSGPGDSRWVIDPIDGTKSFLSGVPFYATLLSYESHGVPVLGVAYAPALDEMVCAVRGGGCHWNGRRCSVSEKAGVSGSVVCCSGHAGMEREGRTAGVLGIAGSAMATRTWSDAYGHMLVATGRVEAMLDFSVARWDVSPIVPIILEAGGRVSRFDGEDALLPRSGGDYEVVSSNGLVHGEVLAFF